MGHVELQNQNHPEWWVVFPPKSSQKIMLKKHMQGLIGILITIGDKQAGVSTNQVLSWITNMWFHTIHTFHCSTMHTSVLRYTAAYIPANICTNMCTKVLTWHQLQWKHQTKMMKLRNSLTLDLSQHQNVCGDSLHLMFMGETQVFSILLMKKVDRQSFSRRKTPRKLLTETRKNSSCMV